MEQNDVINIEVAYALPDKQRIIALQVNKGCNAYDAVMQSGMEKQFPNLKLDEAKLGIFGKAVTKPAAEILKDGDRIEIYRPLIKDPKEGRKERASKAKAEKAAKKASL
jgi:putative ubiquitin-RnfH superfamily antitoxin RatB of RatAB toxin-antitoxin module